MALIERLLEITKNESLFMNSPYVTITMARNTSNVRQELITELLKSNNPIELMKELLLKEEELDSELIAINEKLIEDKY